MRNYYLTDNIGWLKSYDVNLKDKAKTVMTENFSDAIVFNAYCDSDLEDISNFLELDVTVVVFSSPNTSTSKQIGGEHYIKQAIQPIEYINANKLSFNAGNVVKYVSRYKSKNGIEDLKKAKHYIDFMIEFRFNSSSTLTKQSYNKLTIQPHEYCFKNGYNSLQYEAIEKVSRDVTLLGLRQAQKAIDTLISFEYE